MSAKACIIIHQYFDPLPIILICSVQSYFFEFILVALDIDDGLLTFVHAFSKRRQGYRYVANNDPHISLKSSQNSLKKNQGSALIKVQNGCMYASKITHSLKWKIRALVSTPYPRRLETRLEQLQEKKRHLPSKSFDP